MPAAGCQPDGDTLAAWVGERLADYKRPRQFITIDELPRNALGKVQKPRLRPRFARPDDPE